MPQQLNRRQAVYADMLREYDMYEAIENKDYSRLDAAMSYNIQRDRMIFDCISKDSLPELAEEMYPNLSPKGFGFDLFNENFPSDTQECPDIVDPKIAFEPKPFTADRFDMERDAQDMLSEISQHQDGEDEMVGLS